MSKKQRWESDGSTYNSSTYGDMAEIVLWIRGNSVRYIKFQDSLCYTTKSCFTKYMEEKSENMKEVKEDKEKKEEKENEDEKEEEDWNNKAMAVKFEDNLG